VTALEQKIEEAKQNNHNLKVQFDENLALKQKEVKGLISENEGASAKVNELHETLEGLKKQNSEFADVNDKHQAAQSKF
jgi:predicted nuclease with TOPRIM domain